MLTFNNLSEYFNMQLIILTGQAFLTYGFLISVNSLIDMDLMGLEYREQDQCFKEYLNKFQKINVKYFTFYMLSFNNNTDYILMQYKFMIE